MRDGGRASAFRAAIHALVCVAVCSMLNGGAVWAQPGASPSITMVAFGDSTTAPRGPLRVFAQFLEEALPKRDIHARVLNRGVGGNTTTLACKRFKRDVLDENPDIVTLFFGINDAAVDVWKDATEPRVSLERFEKNLCYFIKELRAHGAQPILLTPNPLAWTPELRQRYGKPPYDPDVPEGFNTVLESYAERVRTIARSEDVPLVDVDRLFRDYAKMGSIHEILLDGMHPNDLGHRLIANALLEAMPTCLPRDGTGHEGSRFPVGRNKDQGVAGLERR